jgi:hypothetical protein
VLVRVELHPVPAAEPPRHRFAQRRLSRGGGVAADRPDGVDQRLPDERRRRLVGVADREVVQRLTVGAQLAG